MFSEGTERSGRTLRALLLLLLVWQGSGRAEGVRSWELPVALPLLMVASSRVPALEERVVTRRLRHEKKAPLRKEKEKQLSRRRLYLTAALVTSSGVVAWWSKERADRAYDRYLRAASLRRQEQQFERVERYDRIAGAAFIGMEAGLVMTTYLIFF